jgi:hypothetical protein
VVHSIQHLGGVMARKKRRIPARSERPKLCLTQEVNLLQFLNFIDTPEQLACVIGRDDDDAVLKIGTRILDGRAKIGAFLTLEDVASIVPIKSEIATQLLNAARSVLTPVTPVETVSLLPLLVTAPFALAFPGRILFDIKWTSVPPEWVRFITFLIELSSKRLAISQRYQRIVDRLAELRRTLQQVKASGDAEGEARVSELIDQKMREQAEVQREHDAINNLVQKKDLKGLVALVIRNIEEEIKDLKRKRAAALNETPPDLDAARRFNDEINDKSDSIDKIRQETGN